MHLFVMLASKRFLPVSHTDIRSSVQAPRGMIRIKTAREKAAKLALQFLDAIQSPRLNMNDGDDLRGIATPHVQIGLNRARACGALGSTDG
jgi:hypothetical protein